MLDGIPISIKDGSYLVKGMPSNNGSHLNDPQSVDLDNCPIVEKLIN